MKPTRVRFKGRQPGPFYPTPPALWDREGYVVEVDGALSYVVLDSDAALAYGAPRYWAFEHEYTEALPH